MSHFSVIVESKEEPSEEVLEPLLQPFHEFECTGTDDRYVQTIDKTEEAREAFEKSTSNMLRKIDDGTLHSFFDDKGNWRPEFSQPDPEPHAFDMNRRVRFVPPGYEEAEVATSELESFAEWAADYYGAAIVPLGEKPDLANGNKYGYTLVNGADVRVFNRTNPNKKWDSWRIGGRWRGRFLSRNGKHLTGPLSYEWEYEKDPPPQGSDIIQKRNIDFAATKAKAVRERSKHYGDCMETCKLSFSELEAAIIDHWKAHEAWMKLEEPRPRGKDFGSWCEANGFTKSTTLKALFGVPNFSPHKTAQAWIDSAPGIHAFAFLGLDGVWRENGQMGWWGMVRDEKPVQDWQSELDGLLAKVPDHHWLTVVDCHI